MCSGSLLSYLLTQHPCTATSLRYTQVYHGEKPLLRRIFGTVPGWLTILATIFFFVNTYFVINNELFDGGDSAVDRQDRTCAPVVPDPETGR